MSGRRVDKAASSGDQLNEALAALIACTRSKKRPLSLVRIAEWTEVAVDSLGSYKAVAERIGITSKMLRQFSYVKRLSRPVRELFENRMLDSVDAATHLTMLAAKDQLVVAQALADGVIDTNDLRAVVQWRKERPRTAIDALVKGVRESKTQQRYVAEFVVRESRSRRSILAALQKHIRPEDIVDVEIDGPFGRLVLTRKGKQQLFNAAKEIGVGSKHVIAEILAGASAE